MGKLTSDETYTRSRLTAFERQQNAEIVEQAVLYPSNSFASFFPVEPASVEGGLIRVPVDHLRAKSARHTPLEESGCEALRRYPQLGAVNSEATAEFARRYKEYRQTQPEFFRSPTWPLRLAEEIYQTK